MRKYLAIFALVCSASAQAVLQGHVQDESGLPIAGALVHLQAEPLPFATTDSTGYFSLAVEPEGRFVITAALPYDPTRPVNYQVGGRCYRDLNDPACVAIEPADIIIPLKAIPVQEDPDYQPLPVEGTSGCGRCHQQTDQWITSRHAGAATNPWVLDLFSGSGTDTAEGASGYVFTTTHDPGDTGFCAVCHAPTESPANVESLMLDEVVTLSGNEGVNCTACHQLHDVNHNSDALHLLGNAEFRFPEEENDGSGFFDKTHQYVWGPLSDVVYPAMRASYAPVFKESRFCASCHEYKNPFTGAPGQSTYSEWLASPYAGGENKQTCQNCHMPQSEDIGVICNVGLPSSPIRSGEEIHRHDFQGATLIRIQQAIGLQASARINGGRLQVASQVDNHGAGHHFPTGISLRNAFVRVEARLNGNLLSQVSGPVLPDLLDDAVAGKQPGDYAGEAGQLYAKVLRGQINGQGAEQYPVLFIDANAVELDTSIPAGARDDTGYAFNLPTVFAGDQVEVKVELYYRRAWRALVVQKGWHIYNGGNAPNGEPWEQLIHDVSIPVTVDNQVLEVIFSDGLEHYKVD